MVFGIFSRQLFVSAPQWNSDRKHEHVTFLAGWLQERDRIRLRLSSLWSLSHPWHQTESEISHKCYHFSKRNLQPLILTTVVLSSFPVLTFISLWRSPGGRRLVDEFFQRDPPVPTEPPQSRHLSAIPTFCQPEGRIPRKWRAVLAGGAEVQGKRSWWGRCWLCCSEACRCTFNFLSRHLWRETTAF